MHIAIVVDALLAVFALEAAAMLAAWLLRQREYAITAFLPYLVSVATGLLLATALLHLLPEAIEALGNRSAVWIVLVVTILGLYSFERVFQVLSGVSAEPAADADEAHERGHHHHHHAQSVLAAVSGVTK